MLSSVQKGLTGIPDNADAVMILLGDQPMIKIEVINQMISACKQSDKAILVARHGKKRGHPLVFRKAYIKEILSYAHGSSLRDLLENHPGEIEEVEVHDPGILKDIDTEQDYLNALNNQK